MSFSYLCHGGQPLGGHIAAEAFPGTVPAQCALHRQILRTVVLWPVLAPVAPGSAMRLQSTLGFRPAPRRPGCSPMQSTPAAASRSCMGPVAGLTLREQPRWSRIEITGARPGKLSNEAAPAGDERRRGAATAAAAPPWTTWRRLAERDMVGAKAAAEPARASTAQVLATTADMVRLRDLTLTTK